MTDDKPTAAEVSFRLDVLGGYLLSGGGPQSRVEAGRLLDALRQLRAEHADLHMKWYRKTCRERRE